AAAALGPVPGGLDLQGEPAPAPATDPTPAPPTGLPEPPAAAVAPVATAAGPPELARRQTPRRGRRLIPQPAPATPALTPPPPPQALRRLAPGHRGALPAGACAARGGLSQPTRYRWKHRFDAQGPGGLMDQPRGGPAGSQLPELTKRTLLLLTQAHPDCGCPK